jgi:hypothetical protein
MAHGEATHSIGLAAAVIFLLPFSAQKTHVKPPNHITQYQTTTSEWHFSLTQFDVLNIEIKTSKAPWDIDTLRGLIH